MKRWQEGRSGAVAGVALVLLGTGLAAASTSIDAETTPEVRGDAPVNEGARDSGDISANNSPTLARNPRRRANLAVVNRIDSPRFSCALHVSFDGGSRWARVPIEIPKGEERKCYAPDVTFTSDGRLHISYVTLRGRGNVPSAVWLVSSGDGGRTLSEPRKLVGPLAFQVRLAADPNDPRRLYLSWVQASGVGLYKFEQAGNPILMARSVDSGSTWERPVRVNDASRLRAVAPSVAVGPKGEVYMLYLDLGEDRLDYEGAHEGRGGRPYAGRFELVLGRSLDHGATWAESVVDDSIVPIERFIAFLPSFPSVAVDPKTGQVYAGYHDRRFGTPDVLVWSRAAGGAEWAGPTRVNDTPKRDGSSQYLPKLAVAPNGRVDVVYYDRRSDPRNVMNGVSLQSSFDHGTSFGASSALSSQAFDSRIGYGSERDLPDLGSRLGVLADDSSAYAVWTDTRAGSVDSNKQDLALARAVVPNATGTRRAAKLTLGYGGAALAVSGLLVLGSALRKRRASAGRG